MKSILVIGLGDFGHYLCHHLVEMKNEVLVVDKDEEALEDLQEIASGRIIADCTNKVALAGIGISNFDVCFVCVGSDFKSNLIIVTHLRELGAKCIVSQTDDEMLEKLLLRNGADDVIHPNKHAAMRAAVSYSSEQIFDYVQLRAGYAIYEITPLKEWVGKSIVESQIRKIHDAYIISISSADGTTVVMPKPDAVIQGTDRLMVLMHEKTMEKLLEQM